MKRKEREIPKQGDVFGRLTITGKTCRKKAQSETHNRTYYEAVCSCGVTKEYQLKYLLNGNTKSCGCHKKDAMKAACTTHGLTSSPLYSVYSGMEERCYTPKHISYHRYGGRGIVICEEWRKDIRLFVEWALANGYKKGLEIDRRDNDGIYEPSNCRFVTRRDGNKNTSRNIFITAFGETKCASEWVEDKRCKVTWNGLKGRLATGKWDIEDAITKPINEVRKVSSRNMKTSRMVTAFGETKCVVDWIEDERCKISLSTFKNRLHKGWSIDRIFSTPKRGA